ncbi:MAG: hypothetical protein IJK81_02355 [Selenomonadaceae bacterium]|nr:hypothetical protein [Selenomonadaceae bacterium]
MTQIINLFRRNFLKKLVALIAAFFMWIFVMAEQDPSIEGSYTVPLTMSNAPYELVAICDDKTIQVEARAPRSNFVKYDANAFRAYADLEGLEAGEHQISPKVIMPQGFELLETKPFIIKVKLDPLIEQQTPIILMTTGAVAQDVIISNIRKSMDMVTLVGPKSFVEQVNKVYGTLNLSNNTSSFETQIPMNAVDANNNVVQRVRVVPSVITVSVDVDSGVKKKIVPIVPEISVADGWEINRISVEPTQMEIVGAESVVNSITSLRTAPFIVQTGQKFFRITMKLQIPDGVTVKSDEVIVSAEIVRKASVRDQP